MRNWESVQINDVYLVMRNIQSAKVGEVEKCSKIAEHVKSGNAKWEEATTKIRNMAADLNRVHEHLIPQMTSDYAQEVLDQLEQMITECADATQSSSEAMASYMSAQSADNEVMDLQGSLKLSTKRFNEKGPRTTCCLFCHLVYDSAKACKDHMMNKHRKLLDKAVRSIKL